MHPVDGTRESPPPVAIDESSQPPRQAGEEESLFQESFPPPPPHYKLFTRSSSSSSCIEEAPLPPPAIPFLTDDNDGNYMMYGMWLSLRDVIKRPRDEHVKELFTDPLPHEGAAAADDDDDDDGGHGSRNLGHVQQQQLRAMQRSVLFNYVELLDILLAAPDAKLRETPETSIMDSSAPPPAVGSDERFARELKEQQIQLLLINMSYLLNSYRPHQAREQVLCIMRDQLERKRRAAELIDQCIAEAKEVVQRAKQKLDESELFTVDTASGVVSPLKRRRPDDDGVESALSLGHTTEDMDVDQNATVDDKSEKGKRIRIASAAAAAAVVPGGQETNIVHISAEMRRLLDSINQDLGIAAP